MMKSSAPLLSLLLLLHLSSSLSGQVTPREMVERMGAGLNLGNTLEAPQEGNWSPPAQAFHFHDMADAGLRVVRIPVRWTHHMDSLAPYQVHEDWMARVEQVIDWALDTGLVVIINSHHDNEWLYDDFPANLDRFEALWEQIATRFSDKSENLVFEIVNEPYFDLDRDEVDTLHQVIFPIIRESNPTRIVLFTGGGNDTSPRLTNYRVIYHMKLPDDPYIMAYFHYYVPYQYCQLGNGTWGSGQEKSQMEHDFREVRNWSDTTGVPVLLGEFGVIKDAHRSSMVNWYEHLAATAGEVGFAQTAWCNGNLQNGYGIYSRSPNYWDQELLNILTRQFPFHDTVPSLPCTLEAEDFDLGGEGIACHSIDTLNGPGYYRPQEAMDIDSLGHNSYALVFSGAGEWAEYSFALDTGGLCELRVRASATQDSATLQVRFNGDNLADLPSLISGDAPDTFMTLTDTLYLEAGVQFLRILGDRGVKVDRIELQQVYLEEDTSNLLVNPDFELGMVGWSYNSCVIAAVETPVQHGQSAAVVSDRKAHWASIQQDITGILLENGPGYYTIGGHMRTTGGEDVSGKITVRLTVGGEKTYLGWSLPIDSLNWTCITQQLFINWEGELEEAYFYLETLNPYAGDFCCDNTLLRLDSSYVAPTGLTPVHEEAGFRLEQNVPNPFSRESWISFCTVETGPYTLEIFDAQGRLMERVFDETIPPGRHQVRVEAGSSLQPGIYIYRLKGAGGYLSRRMLVR
jgi:aryl-phospho-beta-D-glucosidase BglC (GH1 family)